MSSLLHERLQRERRAASTDLLNMAMRPRDVRSPSPADSQRPGSSGGVPVPGRRKGWTIKEMEHTLSTLHKQNFDLKLELFHRREKQTAMEERLAMFDERLEMLEKEKIESAKKNDQLASELEKRDKAVEEAVAIIVALESRLESLLRERETARKIEPDSSPLTRVGSPAQAPSTNVTRPEPFNTDEPKSLNRMPSFVSDRSDNTQNLRSVYLGAREPSLVSLSRTEDTPNTTRIHYQLASPVPSVLSESSFVSVYGRNRTIGDPAADDSPLSAKAACHDRELVVSEGTPTKAPRPTSSRAARGETGQFHNIGDVLDVGRSPLQRLEKLKMAPAALPYSPRASTSPPTSSNNTDQSPFARPAKARKERQETLHKVLTQGPFNNEQQPKGLPPTPDTLSTTTLHAQQPTSTEEMADGRHSPASSIDPWMCESFRPANVDRLDPDPMSSASQAGSSARPGRISPDLFSFPSSTSGWVADAMFGSLGGAGFMGAGGKTSPVVPMAPMANMPDATGRSIPSGRSSSERLAANRELATAAPAPPNRRSSLLARTGLLETDMMQAFDSTPEPASLTASSFKRSPARGDKVRRNSNTDPRLASRHLADVMGPKQDRAMTVPPKQVHHPPPTQQSPQSQAPKQRHYPPTASQASRPRSRGLNGFFRRSIGSSHGTPFAAPPGAPPVQPPTPKSPSVPLVGVPSWVRRSSLATDDERSSATPPPILRKKPAPVPAQTSGRVDYDEDGGAALSTGTAECAENDGAPVGNGGGGKRKWLSLGRANLRTRGV